MNKRILEMNYLIFKIIFRCLQIKIIFFILIPTSQSFTIIEAYERAVKIKKLLK